MIKRLMPKGEYEKMGFQKVLSSLQWKNISEQKQSKMLEREPKNEEWKWNEKKKRVEIRWREIRKEEQSRNDPSRDEMIIGLIILKHSLGLLIFSFKTSNQAYNTYLKRPFWSNVGT